MTKEEVVVEKLKILQKLGDTEIAHSMADELLLKFLSDLGYSKIVDEFNKIEKWYA